MSVKRIVKTLKDYKEVLAKYQLYFDEEPKEFAILEEKLKRLEERLKNLKDSKEDGNTDDLFVVTNVGGQKILTPKKPNGRTIYFFYGYTGTKSDKRMRSKETANLADDVIDAALRGFKVVYDDKGSKADFETALYDSKTAGIYWSGHGTGGGVIETNDSGTMRPSDFDPNKVSSNLQFLIFASCNSGQGKDDWEKLINKKAVDGAFEGWKDITYIRETNDFTSSSGHRDEKSSHKGLHPDKELTDYIDKAEDDVIKDKEEEEK